MVSEVERDRRGDEGREKSGGFACSRGGSQNRVRVQRPFELRAPTPDQKKNAVRRRRGKKLESARHAVVSAPMTPVLIPMCFQDEADSSRRSRSGLRLDVALRGSAGMVSSLKAGWNQPTAISGRDDSGQSTWKNFPRG